MLIHSPESIEEANKMITLALNYLDKNSLDSEELINWGYTPNPQISSYLTQLKTHLQIDRPTREQKQQAGYLLEKIIVLAFQGLPGLSEIKNYQSGSHQYDLLVSGDDDLWNIVCDRLYLKKSQDNQNCRGILIEAKAIGASVSSAQFARLCSMMNLNFCDTVGLGVFFTIQGASGFPRRGDRRFRCIKDARLCQVIFKAKSGKNIVVLDKDDIFELDKNGSLIKILIRKIKEIEELSGLATTSVDEPIDVDLPSHLKDLI